MKRNSVLSTTILTLLLGVCSTAGAEEYTWLRLADSDDWYGTKVVEEDEINNWFSLSPGFPDSSTDDVIISKAEGGWTVELTAKDTSVRDLTIGAGDSLTTHRILTIYSDTIGNAGTLGVEHITHLTAMLRLTQSNTMLSGGGTLRLSDSHENEIHGLNGDERLVNVDNTIEGAGHLCQDVLSLTNQALVNANWPSGTELMIDPNVNVINTGIMQASGGGTLGLYNDGFINSGGIIQALDGSEVVSYSAGIVGGELRTEGSGLIRLTHTASLEDVTNSGALEIATGSGTLRGALTNTGTIEIPGFFNYTRVRMDGTVTLTGGGTVHLTGTYKVNIEAAGGGGELINEDNVISGAGLLGNDSLALTNRGTIKATEVTAMTIDVNGTAGMTNEGLMQAVGTGGFDIDDDRFTNAATVEVMAGSKIYAHAKTYLQTAGTTLLDGVLRANTVRLQGGELMGTGTIEGDLDVTGGTVKCGLSMGRLVVEGDIDFSDGVWQVEIDNTGNADHLQVSGDATFTGGYVDVAIVDCNAPASGDTWVIMSADSVVGAETLRVQPGYSLSVDGADLVLQFDRLPGDSDLDNDVDMVDFAIVSDNWGELSGMTWTDGSFDGDEKVDLKDLLIQTEHWLIGVR